jgi:uncharacterized protein YndB with AHSA1/START domain
MKAIRLVVILSIAASAYGEVASSSPSGFSVKYLRTVAATPAAAYNAFVKVQSWWSSDHTWSGSASNLSLDPRAGGCFCEKLTNGGVVHMTVVYVKKNEGLTLSGALGPLQSNGIAAAMTVTFKPAGKSTDISVTYNAGGYFPGGMTDLATIVDQVLGAQVDRLARLIDTGNADAKKP